MELLLGSSETDGSGGIFFLFFLAFDGNYEEKSLNIIDYFV